MPSSQYLAPGDGLIIVDVQNDFCPGGALPIPEGDGVVPVINEWIAAASSLGLPIYFSRDFHPHKHPSFQELGGEWPVHCVQDTWGAKFHAELSLPREGLYVTKGVRFDRDQNSALDETGLTAQLARDSIHRVFVAGLALDVCVQATVEDALKAGYQTWLILEGCRAVTEESGQRALEAMQKLGCSIIH